MTVEARYAGVLALHGGRVALVREQYSTWGGSFWNVPSGSVEPGETPAEGAARELAEETGIVVSAADLVAVSTTEVRVPGKVSRAWNFEVEPSDPTLRVEDPDGLIQETRWFDLDAAVEALQLLPHPPLREPAIAILTGAAARGSHWKYAGADQTPDVTPPGP